MDANQDAQAVFNFNKENDTNIAEIAIVDGAYKIDNDSIKQNREYIYIYN